MENKFFNNNNENDSIKIKVNSNEFNPDEWPKPPKSLEDIYLSENSYTVMKLRYLRKGDDGEPIETVMECIWRVAINISKARFFNNLYNEEHINCAINYYDLIAKKYFSPNSPTFTGAGTPLGQLAACFVLPIDDEMGREENGIFQTMRNASLIQQTGGGNGFDFSKLRHKGAIVKSSGGLASGPLGFLGVYDKAFGEVAQGGTRRGANMAVLRVDHPDIIEFIGCKGLEGSIENFNISVGVTDEFMKSLLLDDDFNLVAPHNGKVIKTLKAKFIWEKIIEGAHNNGEPGILFLDTANKYNPVPNLYKLEATNPCGEQWLGPYENCCLGSINLTNFVKNGVIDWELLADKTKLATRFLDDLIDVNKYVVGVPQLEEAAKKSRRIGLGIMGLADMLILCDCGYGSKKGNELSSKVMEWIRYNCMIESIKLSKEIEPFLSIKGSIYDPNDLKWKPPKPLLPYEYDFGRPEFSWNIVVDGIKKYGIRNAAQTTVAPTGTISTVFGNEGYGCEPIFAFGYTRNVINGDDNLILEYNSDLFKKAINNIKNMDSKVKKSILSTVSNKGSCKDINQLPQDIKDIFVCAKDLSVDQHVILQASLQAFVDNSMSKTCNCPEYTTVEKISDVYLSAWKLGCKGITVYRESSRNKVVLETREVTKNKSKKIQNNNEIKESLFGVTTHLPSSYGTINVTLNQDGQGNPHEIFINVGKSGSSLLAVGECIGRLVSYILKNAPSDKTPAEALIDVIKQLKGIGGSNPNGLGVKRVESIPDGIAIALSKNLLKLCEINNTKNCENLLSDSIDFSEYFNKDQGKRETKKTKEIKDLSNKHLTKSYSDNMLIRRKDMCPECGQVMLYVSGCGTCTDCGYEKCK